MRAGGKNKQYPRNKYCIILQHGQWCHKQPERKAFISRGSLSETFFWKERFVFFWQGCLVSTRQRSRERRTGYGLQTTRRPSETLTHSSSSAVEDCRTKHQTEDVSKAHVLSGKWIFLEQTHKGRELFDVRHMPRYWAFSHTVDFPKRKRGSPSGSVLRSSPIKPVERRQQPAIPATSVSLFSFLFFFFWELHLLASLGALKMQQVLVHWKCCSTTFCRGKAEDLQAPDRVEATVPLPTRKLCGGIPRSKSESKAFRVFFFRLIGEN